mmetsp:Transcript_24406/g.36217  ORF Transcript_24406/g.36217 Transcript_24406/m.36217 type:complete len:230 (+) Transcript_24406:337-1026(+)|eukprot:CAMPEP_0194222600 /NCGR_PEP_ID=MMETSP0156-20130528/33308_1 /TAXON_ID=33649 /ORGANISM="Thalassionema nitzschioides, Strain L26-B" /LENGTH=229 /DNA_ID=CAMNT_0038953453 /DNA_START=272 /DNA_END=961 /DNA_ORIENTATION=-
MASPSRFSSGAVTPEEEQTSLSVHSEQVRDILENFTDTESSSSKEDVNTSTLPDEHTRARAIAETLIDSDEELNKKFNPSVDDDTSSEEEEVGNTLETGVLSRATFHRRGFLKEIDLLPNRKELLTSSRALFGSEEDVEKASAAIPKPLAIERFTSIDLSWTPPKRARKSLRPQQNYNAGYDPQEQPTQVHNIPTVWKGPQRTWLIVGGMTFIALVLIALIIFFLTDYI